MEFFIFENNRRLGPLSLEEIKSTEIHPDTQIWFEGLTDWTPAKDLSLFAHFQQKPQTNSDASKAL